MKHLYQPSPEIQEKVRTNDFAKIVKDALSAWSWCFDNHDEDFAIGINMLHKSVFCKRTRAQVDEVLDLLEKLKVLSAPSLVPTTTARNKREVRYLEIEWTLSNVPKDSTPGDVFTSLESKLFDRVMNHLTPKVDNFEFKDVSIVRVLLDFTSSYWGLHRRHQAGNIIDDFDFAQHLLRTNAPVAPYDSPNLVLCPTCELKFDYTLSRPDLAPLICLDDLLYSLNGIFKKRSKGELITDYPEIQHVLTLNIQTAYAKEHEFCYCPNESCQTRYFKRV